MSGFEKGELVTIEDGGQAFPCAGGGRYGMTLRDYIAVKVLAQVYAAGSTLNPDRMADIAYKAADAMIERRSSPS